MIDLKEKPRRSSKRKFEENGRVQPKETLLDMSVSKLAKAQRRVNLEPSLRKTVMIVNTIRKLEQEIENGRTKTLREANVSHCSPKTNNYSDTRRTDSTVFTCAGTRNSAESVQKRLDLPLETRDESFVCENYSETFNRCPVVTAIAKSCRSDDTFVDLAQSTEMKFKNRFEDSCASNSNTSMPVEVTTVDCEINFAEVDISLYDFDTSMAWSEGGLQLPCVEDTDSQYKHCSPLSTFTSRCSDDLKLGKTTENSFTDDLDQIMQVLVGI